MTIIFNLSCRHTYRRVFDSAPLLQRTRFSINRFCFSLVTVDHSSARVSYSTLNFHVNTASTQDGRTHTRILASRIITRWNFIEGVAQQITGAITLLNSICYVEAGSCTIIDRISSCRYTVLCEVHAGSVSNLECYSDIFVTFRMTNSQTEVLTTGFFGATNFDSRVRVLTATNNKWTTISSNAFRYYTKSVQVNLSQNQIREISDKALINLVNVKSLNLSSNLIETLYSQSLMTVDMKVSEIEILDLSNNLLKNIASDAFNPCANVLKLYLQNNNIVNLEDNTFSSLKNLTFLYLQNNKLTELNVSLISLKNLKELDLSYNRIAKIAGYETNRLTSLQRVNMSNNAIEFIEANCFNQAFNLESLDLSNNYIKPSITNIMFMNNGKLNYLNLYNNSISMIQGKAFQHNNLSYINLEKNIISGEITDTTFAGLQRVKNLKLYKQNLTSINAFAFKEMTGLENLNISNNNINVVNQTSFKNTRALVVLDLSHNNISYLHFFKDTLTNLTEIYLNNNNIELIPGYTFVNQTLLTKLDISNNRIITIEPYALPLKNLQFLNVSGNLLRGSVISNVFSPGQYLRYLDLSKLNISRIEDMAFTDLPVLARLNLSFNAIQYIGQKNFLNLNNVYSLDLSNNRLSSLQLNGSYMKSLRALYLNNNYIRNITGVIPNAPELTYLDISHNNISVLTDAVFENLKELLVLRLSNNKIRNFNNPQINLLSKLKDLDLSSNQVSVIDLRYYKDLVKLDISNNILKTINSTLLFSDGLQFLNLCNNSIFNLPPGVFQNAKNLQYLNISFNSLTTLRYGSLKGLHNSEVIDMSRNNFTKMDVDVFHECKELKRLIIDYNHIKQLDVEQLINVVPNLISLSIGGNPIECKEIIRSFRNINRTSVNSVDITSIDKIFHEDNVHGIRCGDIELNTTLTMISTSTSKPQVESPQSSVLVIWCSVLTVLFVLLIAVFLLWKRYHGSLSMNSQARLDLRRSVELSGSDFQSDLLN